MSAVQSTHDSPFAAPADSFSSGPDTSVVGITSQALKLDRSLKTGAKFTPIVHQTAKNYRDLAAKHEALKAELQDQVDSFLGIDFSKLASGGLDFIKNAAGKINGIVNQIGPYVNTAKSVLAAVSGDSFDEAPIPKELRKDHKDVTTALANVETKVDNIDAGWKQAGAHAKELQVLADNLAASGPPTEEAFFGLISAAISIAVPIVKSFL